MQSGDTGVCVRGVDRGETEAAVLSDETHRLDENDPVQTVDGVPRPVHMESYICGLALEKGCVDVGLQSRGRMRIGDSEAAWRGLHRSVVGLGVWSATVAAEIGERRGEGES